MNNYDLTEQELETYQHVLNHFKEKRVRLTQTRKAVLAFLIHSSDHPSAEMIYQSLVADFPKLSLATVYNNLKFLLDAGFITEIKRSNDTTIYYDFMGHDHLNIICEKCGKITDLEIDLPSFESIAQQQTGYSVTKELITIYGICPECTKNLPVS